MHQKLDIFVQRLENNDQPGAAELRQQTDSLGKQINKFSDDYETYDNCLLYTSDAADDLLCVDLGGRRIIKKNKKKTTHTTQNVHA